ncbi:Cof-type HAD-IIB family hydrolase [Paenibacillus tarimensis]|uniref:Cof-type HAD-IIB family hydrolase n=1 Tax=Paenibacillus tarimensis TaxID=416012 RepID=UPI001F171448|nr:Cof-type HAD-IIB family hydrolase [Paenibacillus tarimensis]MCF2943764.1 Cof-type HAD-IIB family hydrolase [Paenibacillus tarimensis]
MGNYRLIALDMDGTVLNDRQEISKENAEWIHKAMEAGITVCFSTGRGFESALPYAEQLGLETPMITVNGSEIWHRPHVLHQRTLMNASMIKRLHELAMQSDVWFWAYAVEGLYNRERWIEPADNYEGQHWLKFGYYTENDALRESILAVISQWGGLEITNSSPWNIELNPAGVSKAAALEELCTLLGITMEQVVTMGDSLNDLAMIRAAGLGVAMGNAQDTVKAEADFVTLTNDEHGVAHAIEHIVMKG